MIFVELDQALFIATLGSAGLGHITYQRQLYDGVLARLETSLGQARALETSSVLPLLEAVSNYFKSKYSGTKTIRWICISAMLLFSVVSSCDAASIAIQICLGFIFGFGFMYGGLSEKTQHEMALKFRQFADGCLSGKTELMMRLDFHQFADTEPTQAVKLSVLYAYHFQKELPFNSRFVRINYLLCNELSPEFLE